MSGVTWHCFTNLIPYPIHQIDLKWRRFQYTSRQRLHLEPIVQHGSESHITINLPREKEFHVYVRRGKMCLHPGWCLMADLQSSQVYLQYRPVGKCINKMEVVLAHRDRDDGLVLRWGRTWGGKTGSLVHHTIFLWGRMASFRPPWFICQRSNS